MNKLNAPDGRKKRNAETTYEIRLGQWQDTPPAIFLCVVL